MSGPTPDAQQPDRPAYPVGRTLPTREQVEAQAAEFMARLVTAPKRRVLTDEEMSQHEDFCYSCGRLEVIPDGVAPYRYCIECGHVYWTASELLRRYRQEVERVGAVKGLPTSADDIAFCQECLHDF